MRLIWLTSTSSISAFPLNQHMSGEPESALASSLAQVQSIKFFREDCRWSETSLSVCDICASGHCLNSLGRVVWDERLWNEIQEWTSKNTLKRPRCFHYWTLTLIPGDLSSGLAIPLPLSGHRGHGGTFSVKNRRKVILFTVTPTQDISDRSQPGVYPDHMDDQKGWRIRN